MNCIIFKVSITLCFIYSVWECTTILVIWKDILLLPRGVVRKSNKRNTNYQEEGK